MQFDVRLNVIKDKLRSIKNKSSCTRIDKIINFVEKILNERKLYDNIPNLKEHNLVSKKDKD